MLREVAALGRDTVVIRVATGLAGAVRVIAPVSLLAIRRSATRHDAAVVYALLPGRGTVDVDYALWCALAVYTFRVERISALCVAAARDAQAVIARFGQTVFFVGTVAVGFTTRKAMARDTQLADRAIIIGDAIDAFVSRRIALSGQAVFVLAATGTAVLLFADLSRGTIAVVAAAGRAGVALANETLGAVKIGDALDTGVQLRVAVALSAFGVRIAV